MCGPKCEKVRKPWVLRLKHWSLIMRVSDEEHREREGLQSAAPEKDKRPEPVIAYFVKHASSFVFDSFRRYHTLMVAFAVYVPPY